MTNLPALIQAEDLKFIEGEWMVPDTRVAEVLEFDRPRNIRNLIERNLPELERYGICFAVKQIHEAAGRPGTEYFLTFEQALCIGALSKAPRAPDLREMLIKAFTARKRGEMVSIDNVLGHRLDELFEGQKELKKDTEEILAAGYRTEGNIIHLVQQQETMSRQLDEVANSDRKKPYAADAEKLRLTCHKMGGLCPCGCGERILDENGKPLKNYTIDHHNGRENRELKDLWPLNLKCNQDMRNPQLRRSKEHRFMVFQEELQKLFPDAHSKRKRFSKSRRRATKKVNCADQSEMF
jgi:hypothetical protein